MKVYYLYSRDVVYPTYLTYIYIIAVCLQKSRVSSVGIALGYGMDDRSFRLRFTAAGAGKFSLHHRLQNGSGADPAPYLMGTGALSRRVKRSGREADHSPPSNAEVK
jgi:hypothetical protein